MSCNLNSSQCSAIMKRQLTEESVLGKREMKANKNERLLIVSNRLPVSAEEKDGRVKFKEGAGGLVSGLSAYLDSLKGTPFTTAPYVWVGWPGTTLPHAQRERVKRELSMKHNAHPVFLAGEDMENFYHGFCNKTIWPLFHYFPSIARYDEAYWNDYKRVNEIFRDAVLEILKPGDVVWVHDYHLLLLPALLRKARPDISIGFFLHIPFPSHELFRLIPRAWGEEILRGLLGADLIGFHTHDYTQHFLRCVLRLLGHESNVGEMIAGERVVRADTFPMGIDYEKYNRFYSAPAFQKELHTLKKRLSGVKVVLSVDRLDYTKGILNRLEGYEVFLRNNPQWHEKVALVLIVVPSRVGVEDYQQMKTKIDEAVGKINGNYGTLKWAPVIYRYRYLPFYALLALYRVSRAALITPLRDGMNLVAKEYVAAQRDGEGVLILSEMAGAAKELGEAVLINPNHREEIARAFLDALQMPLDEQKRRNGVMQNRLKNYDVLQWASDYLERLRRIKEEQKLFDKKLLSDDVQKNLFRDFNESKNRLILLDYDGTLIPFSWHPQMAKPTPELLRVLRGFSQRPRTRLVLSSGRDKNTLQKWFGELKIYLVAEHGIWVKGERGWKLLKPLSNAWKPHVLPLLKRSVQRLPGSFIEEKEYSLVWHYRKTETELGSIRAKELADDLMSFTANMDVQVMQGSKVVEVRSAGVNKGTAAQYYLSQKSYDFILAAGDDWTDEDMFRVLPHTAYSIKVGMAASYARFNLHNHKDVVSFLEELSRHL